MIAARLAATRANRAGRSQPLQSLVSKVLNVAVDQGWLDASPAVRMARPSD